MNKGNIVEWNGELCVVEEAECDIVRGTYVPKKARLIPFRYGNCSYTVSDTWPEDPDKRIGSVKYIAECVDEWLKRRLMKMMYADLSPKKPDPAPRYCQWCDSNIAKHIKINPELEVCPICNCDNP